MFPNEDNSKKMMEEVFLQNAKEIVKMREIRESKKSTTNTDMIANMKTGAVAGGVAGGVGGAASAVSASAVSASAITAATYGAALGGPIGLAVGAGVGVGLWYFFSNNQNDSPKKVSDTNNVPKKTG